MLKKNLKLLLILVAFSTINQINCHALEPKIKYVNSFENTNHPQIAYWFFQPNMMTEKNWKSKIDSLTQYSKFTDVFVTARSKVDFYDVKTMHPILSKVVEYAHQKGLKLGLQLFQDNHDVKIENTDRLIQEGEIVLDNNGNGTYRVIPKSGRFMNYYIKSELFKIYAFKKTAEGFYDPSTLTEITTKAKVEKLDKNELSISVDAGVNLNGYTADILTQHYYNICSNYSDQALLKMKNVIKAYADIPFDGIALDEYKNMCVAVNSAKNELFRERLYSIGMVKKMKELNGLELDKVLFDMRYAPEGKPVIRAKAINQYMSVLRVATLPVEELMYDTSKILYGKNTFIGFHNTFHNNLDGDEVWHTGTSWWSIKRDYGHTDENLSPPTVLGVGISYPARAVYNMNYGKDMERVWTKSLYDLRFGIRTIYHAVNDGFWGVAMEEPKVAEIMSKVENSTRLLNRFNPPLPQIKLLVVYGMEAQYNWYPNYSQRGIYDVTSKLEMEGKANSLWQNGYQNIAVATDVINDGRLVINEAGKPTLNGHEFDAVVFLYPQYSKKPTIRFLENYVNKGGKLLVEGSATMDFEGNDISKTWAKIAEKANSTSFSLANVEKLGVAKNTLVDGVENEEGSYTFTNVESLKSDIPATFTVIYKGKTYSGIYKGLAAINFDSKGNLQILSATKFSQLKVNDKIMMQMSKEADVFVTVKNEKVSCIIADETKSTTCKFYN